MQIINYIKRQYRVMLPLFHFMMSFLYERTFILFHLDENIVPTIPRETWITTGLERVIAYILSKTIAFVLIWLLWKVLFFVIDHFKESKYVKWWVAFYVLGLNACVCVFPTFFVRSLDNYITYSYAIRLLPEYWHNSYSGYVYCAMMMVFPHQIGISLLQWTLFAIAIGYMVYRMNQSSVIEGRGKKFLFLIVLIPGISTLVTDPYRTEQYAIASILFVELVIMDIVDQKKRSSWELLGILIYAAFLGTWRTEGIIYAGLAFFALVVWTYRFPWKKTVLWLAGFGLAFVVINFPHKMGNMKYYYKDYSLVNSFSVLQNILNSTEANLEYEGVEKDFEDIHEITPIDAICLFGLDGYRRVNVMQGRPDINQSLAEPEVADAFLKAFYRMVLHNPKIYLKTQISNLTTIMGITEGAYEASPDFEDQGRYPKWTYDSWEIGQEDFLSERFVEEWGNCYTRQIIMVKIEEILSAFAGVRDCLWLDLLMYLGIPFAEVCMVIREFFLWIRKKDSYTGLGVLAFAMLGLYGAIILVMPAGFRVYFHAYYYMSFLLTGVYGVLYGKKLSTRIGRNQIEEKR